MTEVQTSKIILTMNILNLTSIFLLLLDLVACLLNDSSTKKD